MNDRVLVVVVFLLLLEVTEAVVVAPARLTYDATDFENCTESMRLVPTLLLVPPVYPSSSSPPTLATLTQPHTTTQSLPYAQSHGTTTATTQQQQRQPSTPSLHKTEKASPAPKKHTKLNEKLTATQHIEKHTTTKLDETRDSLTTDKSSSQYPKSLSSSSSSSSSSTVAPPSPIHVTVLQPNLPPDTSTLPPPSPTLPLPIALSPSATAPTPKLALLEMGEKLKHLLRKDITLVLSSEWVQEFKKPYLERIRAVNHEMVDKILQVDDAEEESATSENISSCYLPEKRLAHLFHLKTVLLLLLQALPQSLEEMEEAAWNPEITDYIFRPERRAVFDVYGCRQCYALDASGVCRQMFYCKDGEDVLSRTSGRRIVG